MVLKDNTIGCVEYCYAVGKRRTFSAVDPLHFLLQCWKIKKIVVQDWLVLTADGVTDLAGKYRGVDTIERNTC